MKVAIIKYNAGNIQSVDYALKRLGVEASVTADQEEIRAADRVIFPGVGEASTTMAYLREHHLDKLIVDLKQPVLGICLGLQLMCRHSEENNVKCLGIFEETVKKFVLQPDILPSMKIPHMGWNTITNLKSDLFDSSIEGQHCYFVHSFYATTGEDTAALCSYPTPFSAALQKNNFYAVQFHPEKSGIVGAKILENFLRLKI
ncbi:MAG: imidazole glycerol phosphate synthase subunit HisH [Bacteroidetes bacterium]|nr:imidazole glycerol phosphate synthase subunit HisH [Bacteroidota bacterium]MCL6103387.1 imidazole glycerol phosphate synthase subunit HisH [Bacteroidota bacterium]